MIKKEEINDNKKSDLEVLIEILSDIEEKIKELGQILYTKMEEK